MGPSVALDDHPIALAIGVIPFAGASLLAMVVNDYACFYWLIVALLSPSRASLLLQALRYRRCAVCLR
ncbi:hypothetical protein PS862_05535 [Pseudomonas fluorescens]|uniref:Uncharacterized protein n=1 Tax=Pseudomonas fluorescens TaxID=294 RepID=A0A5E7PU99_PSEFL|nr:hypothetical protein PS862_05535 [Pseudomonas fluorescens]